MRKKEQKGFSFVEILVVVAIFAILSVISAVAFQNFNRAASLKVVTEEVLGALVDARNSTLASDGDTVFGIHLDETEIVRFAGSPYSSSDPNNVTYAFVGGVTATGTLVESNTDITFQRLTGQPSATGTIVILDNTDTASSTIMIHASGLIES